MELAEIDVLLHTFLKSDQLPAPEQISFAIPTFEREAAGIRRIVGHHGLNYLAQKIGAADRRVDHGMRFAAEARIQGDDIGEEANGLLVSNMTRFRSDVLDAARYVDARVRLTKVFWVRHPSRARKARKLIRAVEHEQLERERRARLGATVEQGG